LLLYFKNDSSINRTSEKKITQTETSSFIKEIDSNILKPIYIGKKTNNKANNKNIKKELDTSLKEFMGNFFSEMKNKSFKKRFETLGKLAEKNVNLIEYRKKIYDLIISETDSHLQRELIRMFFGMYSPDNNGEIFKPTQNQHEEIKDFVLKMMLNQ
jgi:hypothetical protein